MLSTCQEIAPLLTFLFIFEIFIIQSILCLIRILIFRDRNLHFIGFLEGLIAIFIIINVDFLKPNCSYFI